MCLRHVFGTSPPTHSPHQKTCASVLVSAIREFFGEEMGAQSAPISSPKNSPFKAVKDAGARVVRQAMRGGSLVPQNLTLFNQCAQYWRKSCAAGLCGGSLVPQSMRQHISNPNPLPQKIDFPHVCDNQGSKDA